MPIYEFYCVPCHTVFSFFSRRSQTAQTPACPVCGSAMKREVSPFSCRRSGQDDASESDPADPLAGVDEVRLERAMTTLSGELETLNDEEADPRDSARLFKKFAEMTGMRFNAGVHEALARIEAGADPDQVETDFGELLNDENPFETETGGALRDLLRRMSHEPHRDPKLYDLL